MSSSSEFKVQSSKLRVQSSKFKVLNYRLPKEVHIIWEFIIKYAIVITQLHMQFAQDITSEIEFLAI